MGQQVRASRGSRGAADHVPVAHRDAVPLPVPLGLEIAVLVLEVAGREVRDDLDPASVRHCDEPAQSLGIERRVLAATEKAERVIRLVEELDELDAVVAQPVSSCSS